MKLISATVQGVGRFQDAKINLAGKLIAIVGPNEAGKTTLLRGLSHITSGVPLEPRTVARDVVGASKRSVSATFEVEAGDLDADLLLKLVKSPATYVITRIGDENYTHVTQPVPSYSLDSIRAPLGYLSRMLDAAAARAAIAIVPVVEGEEPTSEQQLQEQMLALRSVVDFFVGDPPSATDVIRSKAELASDVFTDPRWQTHADRFAAVREWIDRPNASKTTSSALWKKAPDFAFFEEDDQDLEAAYELTSAFIASPAAALANLLGLAKLDLSALFAAIEASNDAQRIKLLLRANESLATRFRTTWKQATLSVYLETQGNELKVLIREADHEITIFDERSAGLRAFIALIAFVESGSFDPAPILLIDEAEQHLHIDAQAELIEMLEAQTYASKVVYTTHSPACLPTDMGARVRVVEPTEPNSPVSRVRNNFWASAHPGFSPLMMAMGAGAAAFTPARRAVIAEGATEMVLLPRLLREANELEALRYQIAPGLSEAPKRVYPDLDLEAARVVFLVDGDPGGQTLRKQLVKAGIDSNLIVDSSAASLELFVASAAYLSAANAEIRLANVSAAAEMPSLADSQRWAAVDRWCVRVGLRTPSKISIAARLADAPGPIVSADLVAGLRAMHQRITSLLGGT